MAVIDVTEQDFEREVIERSQDDPRRRRLLGRVVRPVPQLGPVAREGGRAPARARSSSRSSTRTRTRASRARSSIQGIPAVKAFKDGRVVDEFVGAQPPAQVERFFDGLVPSEADALVAAGDEASLRRALELEPEPRRRRGRARRAALPRAASATRRWRSLENVAGNFRRRRPRRADAPRGPGRRRPRRGLRAPSTRTTTSARSSCSSARSRAPTATRTTSAGSSSPSSTGSASTTRSPATPAGAWPRRCTDGHRSDAAHRRPRALPRPAATAGRASTARPARRWSTPPSTRWRDFMRSGDNANHGGVFRAAEATDELVAHRARDRRPAPRRRTRAASRSGRA